MMVKNEEKTAVVLFTEHLRTMGVFFWFYIQAILPGKNPVGCICALKYSCNAIMSKTFLEGRAMVLFPSHVREMEVEMKVAEACLPVCNKAKMEKTQSQRLEI